MMKQTTIHDYFKKKEPTLKLVGYKKKKERRLIGEFKNGRPRYKNFMIEDLTRPIYKFA